MRKKIHIPYNQDNPRYFYTCPYYGEFESSPMHSHKIPTCKTATALTIYYQIFYRHLSVSETNTKPYPLWRHILWISHYDIIPSNDFAIFMDFLCKCPFKTLPQKGFHKYFKKEEFIKEAQYFIMTSHKWDWVVPYLRKTYPTLNFGELYETNRGT